MYMHVLYMDIVIIVFSSRLIDLLILDLVLLVYFY